jgi:hypothetical protein
VVNLLDALVYEGAKVILIRQVRIGSTEHKPKLLMLACRLLMPLKVNRVHYQLVI